MKLLSHKFNLSQLSLLIERMFLIRTIVLFSRPSQVLDPIANATKIYLEEVNTNNRQIENR